MTSQCGPQCPNLNETKIRRHYDVACRVGTHLELMFLLRRNQEVDLLKQELKAFPRVNFWVKVQILFLNFFSFRCFFHIFTVANKLPGFSINRLANVEDFLDANIYFLIVNRNVSMKNFHLNIEKVLLLVIYLFNYDSSKSISSCWIME